MVVWYHGEHSGYGDRPADEDASQTGGREGEPVDEEGSEWLFMFCEFLEWVWNHEGLRKYRRQLDASGQLCALPIELDPNPLLRIERLYSGAFTEWVSKFPPLLPDVFFPQSDVDEVVKRLKQEDDAQETQKDDVSEEKTDDVYKKGDNALEAKTDDVPKKKAGRGVGVLRQNIDRGLDILGIDCTNDDLAKWLCKNVRQYRDALSKRTEKRNPHRYVFGVPWKSFMQRVSEARRERRGRKNPSGSK